MMNLDMIKNFKIVNVLVEKNDNIELAITRKVLEDFQEFKKNNELLYCSMHQLNDVILGSMGYSFSATYKINNEGSFDEVSNRFEKMFEEFTKDNSEDICSISKLTCQDKTYVAEFSVIRDYMICIKEEN